jgi:hypothetical protein
MHYHVMRMYPNMWVVYYIITLLVYCLLAYEYVTNMLYYRNMGGLPRSHSNVSVVYSICCLSTLCAVQYSTVHYITNQIELLIILSQQTCQ